MSQRAVDASKGVRPTKEARERPRAQPFPSSRIEADRARLSWVVACVRPSREFEAVDWWAGRDVFAWTPVVTVYRRVNRAAREKRLRSFAAAPGYVVVGLEPLFPRWASLFACPEVVSVLGTGGTPRVITDASVRALMQLTWTAPEAQKRMVSRAEYGVGDEVRVCGGPLDGFETRVLGIEGEEARIMAHILGAAREVRVGLERLARAG